MRVATFAIICMTISAIASAQNPDDLTDLLNANVQGPVVVMDLVKFKPGGAEKYAIYDGITEEVLKSLGGAVVFRGSARKVGTINLTGTEDEVDFTSWDRVTFRKYPSMQAVMVMASSSEYQDAFSNRLVSVDASLTYAFSGEMPSFGGGSPGNFPMPVVQAPPSSDTVYMLNLLRFAGDAGREQYFTQYGPATTPLISKRGGGPVYFLKGLGPVISNEKIDRLILVRYPSTETFMEMIASDEYQSTAHLRTGAIELGLLFPFSYE